MNRYKIKLKNKKVVGPVDLKGLQQLFIENKISIENEFQLYPIGDWLSGDKINEIIEVYRLSNPSFEEFQFSKVYEPSSDLNEKKDKDIVEDHMQGDREPEDVNNESGGEATSYTLTDDNTDKTIVLNTKKFNSPDKTKVVNLGEVLTESSSNAEDSASSEENELIEDEVEKEEEISIEDKTSVINIQDMHGALMNDGDLALKEFQEEVDNSNDEKLKKESEQNDLDISTDTSEFDDKNVKKKKEKRIGVVGILAVFIVGYLYMDEPPKDVKLVPKYSKVLFPTPLQTLNSIKSQKNFNEGLKIIPIIESGNAAKKDLDLASKHFLTSIENQFRVKAKNGLNEINESINYLIYIYSLRLQNTKHPIKAGETLYGLIKLVQSRVFNNSYVALGVANYYLYFEKITAAKSTIENYLRISKKPTLQIFIKYLEVAIRDGDFKLSRELFDKIKNVPDMPINGTLTLVEFLELDGRNDEAYDLLRKVAGENRTNSKILLKFAEYLIINKDFKTLEAILLIVEKLRGNYSPQNIAKFYEYKGIYAAAKGKNKKSVQYFNYSLKVKETSSLRRRLADLSIGGSDSVETLIRESKSKVLLNQAKRSVDEGKFKVAIQQLVKACDVAPDFLDSRLYFSEVQLSRGLFSAAITSLDLLYSKYPNDVKVQSAMVLAYIESFKTYDGLLRLRALSKTPFGETGKYHYLWGKLHEKEKNYYKAIKSYQFANQINPLLDESHYRTSWIYYKSRKFKFAKDSLNKAIEFNPINLDYKLLYADILYELQGVETSIGYVRNLLKDFPGNKKLEAKIAIFYYRSGQLKYFENYKKKLEQLTIPVPFYYEFMIEESKLESKPEEVIRYSEFLAKVDPSNIQILLELGIFYLDSEKYQDAEKIFLEVEQKLSTFPKIYYYLSKTYLRMQDFDKALEFGEKEKKQNPLRSDGDSVLGEVYTFMEEWDKAIKHFEQAISLNTKDQDALLNLGFIRKEQRQFEQAKELLVRAKSVNDKNPQVYRVLADIYRGMNQNDLAIEQYEAYLKMNPTASDKGEVEGTIKSLR